jgi:hypothetical protein
VELRLNNKLEKNVKLSILNYERNNNDKNIVAISQTKTDTCHKCDTYRFSVQTSHGMQPT